MTTATLDKPILLSAAEFAARPEPVDGSREELVRGEVVTMPPPGFKHGIVQLNIGFLLKAFLKENRIGRATVESGLVTEREPDTVRGPDVAYWSYGRLPAGESPDDYPDLPADLVAEVLSPSNTRGKLAAKIREYFTTGVRLVWVVDPDEQTVTVYTRPGDGTVLWNDATLTGGDVLPGFSCPVASFFESI
ncbi:MAG: Uma2 family endonuclease [Planctomycetia bacterium]|nr:Uma2 family endonuclease [Planctomycetia bacterium]